MRRCGPSATTGFDSSARPGQPAMSGAAPHPTPGQHHKRRSVSQKLRTGPRDEGSAPVLSRAAGDLACSSTLTAPALCDSGAIAAVLLLTAFKRPRAGDHGGDPRRKSGCTPPQKHVRIPTPSLRGPGGSGTTMARIAYL